MLAPAALMMLALMKGPDVPAKPPVMSEAGGAIGVCAFWKPDVDHPIAVELMSGSGDAALEKTLREDFKSPAKPLDNTPPNGWVGVSISAQGAPEPPTPRCA